MSNLKAQLSESDSITEELDAESRWALDFFSAEECRHNDEIAKIFREHNEALVRFLYVKLRSVQEAKEVAQEAYVRMLKLDEPGAISHLQAYLFKVASNIAVDRLRREKRSPEVHGIDVHEMQVSSGEPGVDATLESRQKLDIVRNSIAELPPKCRKAFLFYKIEERSYQEIAKIMSLSESMIRKYVLRALAHCQRRIDEAN